MTFTKPAKWFLGFIAFGVVSHFIMAPSATQQASIDSRNAEVRQHNEKVREEQRVAALKEAQELSGEKCTKNKQAILGESQKRTMKCGWGKPEKINRHHFTSRVNGAEHTREQWVYGDGNYLYFEDGVLTSVQN